MPISGVGLLALRQGDLPRRTRLLERAWASVRRGDIPLYFPWMAAALGAAYALAGRLAEAVPLLDAGDGADALRRSTVTLPAALVVSPWARRYLLAGRLEEAHALR